VAHRRLQSRHLILLSLHVMFLHVSVVVALPSVDPHVYLCGATSDCVAYSHSFVYVYGASFEFVAVAVSRVSRPRLCTVSLWICFIRCRPRARQFFSGHFVYLYSDCRPRARQFYHLNFDSCGQIVCFDGEEGLSFSIKTL